MKILSVFALLLAGCTSRTENADTAAPDTARGSLSVTTDTTSDEPPIGLALKDDGRTVTVDVGRFVEVSLMANAKADEQWALTDAAPAVLERAGTISYADESSGKRFQTFRFYAMKAGRGTLVFERNGGAAIAPVRYTIEVR